ncbi:TPA: DNA internalization-related competence protein ComEC/Rec2 [Listeria monocytogenes]|nr:DNA internalization-related competence protein ComEC/Rec2 [Listeria monocytogenes]HDU7359172.1 DNA internalization-related competence protein ComEC/Rec2 [Listeria monocytogenes]HDU7442548.1 DNA internalization-related competence protein ComEC/Rec2 [Listeria monocytogenes]HDU7446002.1 DNA internalization-related competence protein ComEC/Rec2 [Listeria monocytogenes]
MIVLAIVCANFTSSIVPICICLLGLIAFIKKSKIILLFVLIYFLTYSFLFVIEKFNTSSFTATEYNGNCQIIDNLKIDGDSFQTFVRCEKEKFQLSYKITTEEEQQKLKKLHYGQFISVSANIETPSVNRNQNQFNYQTYLKNQNVHYILRASNLAISSQFSPSFLMKLQNIRLKIITHLTEKISPTISPYCLALISGEKNGFSPEMYEVYQQMGVVHLLAISGLHVNLLIGAIYFLLLKFGITRDRAITCLLVFLPFYVILTGANPPVIRAATMTALLLLSEKYTTKWSSFSAICLSFILFFLLQPYIIREVGFQLSYAVSFGIILSSRQIVTRQQNAFTKSLAISFISTIMSSAVMMYHFYSFSWVGIFFNLIYVPIFTMIILPGCLTVFVLSFFSTEIFHFPEAMLTFFIQLVEKLTYIFAKIPHQTIVTGRPNTVILVLTIITIIIVFSQWQKKKFPLGIFICFCLLCYLASFNFSGKVSFIDVGQGDSILIQLPYNQGNYLIDTGGQLPFEKEAENKPIMKEALAAMPKVKQTIILAGAKWQIGENSFECLYPDKAGEGGNDDSIVLKAVLDGKIWLFTGDLEANGEKGISEQPIKADILKVGHHGSKTSSSKEFIQKVKPTFAVISCGLNNRFGHPHAETINTLEKAGVTILRTDVQGEITYTFGKGFEATLK